MANIVKNGMDSDSVVDIAIAIAAMQLQQLTIFILPFMAQVPRDIWSNKSRCYDIHTK